MSSVTSEDGGCRGGGGLRITVLIFALVYTLFRGVELLLDLLSTFAMIAPLLSDNAIAFKHYLNSESKRVLWRGPYPHDNADVDVTPNSGLTLHQNLTDMDSDAVQLRINLHVWSSYLLMQCLVFIFAWILVFSAKKKYYSGIVVWLAFSTPVFLLSLLHFTLDLCYWDFPSRPLQSQILQGFDIVIQPIGLVLAGCFLYQLYTKNHELRRIDRYNENNGFPRSMGSVTIRQIVEDEQERF